MPIGVTFKVEVHQGSKERAAMAQTAVDQRLGSLRLPSD